MATKTRTKTSEHTATLKDTLTCPLCYDVYNHTDRMPKGLPCLHTMCLHCLAKYIEKNLHDGKLACPVCQLDFCVPGGGAKDVPTNTGLKALIDLLPQDDDTSNNVAKPVCAEHANAQYIFMCQECHVALCTFCITAERCLHRNHRLEQYESAFDDLKKNIKESCKVVTSFFAKIELVQENLARKADAWKDDSKRDLNERRMTFKALIDNWYEEGEQEINEMHDNCVKTIQDKVATKKHDCEALLESYAQLEKASTLFDNSLFSKFEDASKQQTFLGCEINSGITNTPLARYYRKCPDVAQVESHNCQTLYQAQAKLSRFLEKEWQEIGTSQIRIVKSKQGSQIRIVMQHNERRLLYHFIKADITITLREDDDENKTLTWKTVDYAEGEPRIHQLCCAFQTAKVAAQFKNEFENAVKQVAKSTVAGRKNLDILGPKSDSGKFDTSNEDDKIGAVKPANWTTESNVMVPIAGYDEYKVKSKPIFDYPFSKFTLKASGFGGNTKTAVTIDRGITSSPAVTSIMAKNQGDKSTTQNIPSVSSKPCKSTSLSLESGNVDTKGCTSTFLPFASNNVGFSFTGVIPARKESIKKLPVDLASYEVKTGEENEEILFCERARLYRFDSNTSEWKERGVGDIKLLRETNTKKVRVLMRRDQVLKVCLNHYVTDHLTLKPMKSTVSGTTWLYHAPDFSEGKIIHDRFAIKFRSAECASSFKKAVEDAKEGKEDC